MSPVPVREATWPELLSHPGVRERCVLRSRFGFMAVHAGVEGGTLELARGAATASDSSWYAVTQPAGLRWHVSSTQVDPAGSQTLTAFLNHVDVVVAVHGYGRPSRPRDVLVGGGNRELAAHVSACLRAAAPEFDAVDDLSQIPVTLRGLHPLNPVNRTAGGGAQLELPPAARGASSRRSEGSRPCRPPRSVLEGLTQAATRWQFFIRPPAAPNIRG